MTKKLNCILFLDNNAKANPYHERVIKKKDLASTVIIKETAELALEYLRLAESEVSTHIYPNLIFIDFDMPNMDGWKFLHEYKKINSTLKKKSIIVVLTTSYDINAKKKAKATGMISSFKTKPLTKEMLEEIIYKFFTPINGSPMSIDNHLRTR